jgi:hypothetical protein
MNIVLKNKINRNGDLCICVIDHFYPQNDDEIHLSKIHSRLPTTTLKMKRFYKMINIGTSLVKENKVPVKYKDAINLNMDYIRRELVQNNLTIVDEKSSIVYQRELRHEDRKSCKIFDCFK